MNARCSKCGVEKPVDDFSVDRNRASRRKSQCKDCDNARGRAFYAKVRDRRKAQYEAKKDQIAARIRAHREQAEAIYGGVCSGCGSDAGLEFHHLDRDGVEHRKSETYRQLMRRIALGGVQVPDYRLTLLCRRCHHDAHPGHKMAGKYARAA